MSGRYAVFAACALLTSGAQAEPAAKPQAGSASTTAARPPERATSGTLAALAAELGQLALEQPAWIVLGPVTGAEPALTPEQARGLHERLRAVLGSAISPALARSSEPLSPTEARLQARKHGRPLVYVTSTLRAGRLVVDVDVVAWSESFWQRARFPEGIVVRHLSASAPVDAEIRSFLPRPRALWTSAHSVPAPLADVVALGCGADADGAPSLVVVGRREIVRGHWTRDAFVVLAQKSWSELSPLAAAPLRAPLAAVAFGPDFIDVGSSDRAQLVRLNPALTLLASGPRAYPLERGLCASFSSTGLATGQRACEWATPSAAGTRSSTVRRVSADPRSDSSRVLASFTSAQGVTTQLVVQVPAAGSAGSLLVRSPTQRDWNAELGQLGSVVAAADLDGDGTPEIITSSAARDRQDDALRIVRLEGQALSQLLSRPLADVQALAVCPFVEADPLTVVVAAAGRIWVLT